MGERRGPKSEHKGAEREQDEVLWGSTGAQQVGAWNGFLHLGLSWPYCFLSHLDFVAFYRAL